MTKVPRIPPAEWQVMKVVWFKSLRSAQEIIEAIRDGNTLWHPKTIKTLLNRLVKRQALTFEKDGRAYRYKPVVNEVECVNAACKRFAERFFDGSIKRMLKHIVQQEKLAAFGDPAVERR